MQVLVQIMLLFALQPAQAHSRYNTMQHRKLIPVYPEYRSLDPSFMVADPWKIDDDIFSLTKGISPWRAELAAGECLFVPAGCPHAVKTPEATIALSGDFVDSTNRDLCIEQLRQLVETGDPRAPQVLEALAGGGGEPNAKRRKL